MRRSRQLLEHGQPLEHDGFRCFFNLASQEDLVEHGVHFVKVVNKVELAHVAEECVCVTSAGASGSRVSDQKLAFFALEPIAPMVSAAEAAQTSDAPSTSTNK